MDESSLRRLSANTDRRKHADPPLKLAVPLPGLVFLQHALENEFQFTGIDRQRLIVSVTNQFAVADIVGPRLDPLGRADILQTGERSLGSVCHGDPLAVQAVGDVGLVVPPAILFNDCQVFVPALEPVGMACLEDLRREGNLTMVKTFWEIFQLSPQSPHLAVQTGEEKVGPLIVADDPVIESTDLARIFGSAMSDVVE